MRKAIVLSVAATLVLVSVTLLLLLQGRGSRRWINSLLVPPKAPKLATPFGLRPVLLNERARALDSGDLAAAARLNGMLAQEALLRAMAVHQAWLARREPATKLYAQSAERPEWNYRNTAADFFSFHLHAALRLNPSGLESLKDTLAAEARLRTREGLCQPVIAATGRPVAVDHDELMFGSSEYAKDGLLSLYERHGGDLIGKTLVSIVDAIIAQSRHPSRFGPLPGNGAEINGNLLQLCGRLSYAEQRSDYAEFAARIADAMIEQAMAANHGLPPKFYDYSTDTVIEGTLKLKDHGNEAVLGLAEAYAMAVDRRADPAWAERAARWGPPLAGMFELILRHGVNREGLLVATMEPWPPRPSAEKLCDNWGYILSGAVLFTDAARRHGAIEAGRITQIEAEIDRISRAGFARPIGLPWGDSMDCEADALESAMYVAAYRPALREQALGWVDQHIATLFEMQRPNGTAGGAYLDGNFIRTSLLYADVRSGGWRVDPWREDVLVGLASDQAGNAVLTVTCKEPYTGVLRPSQPRHRSIMKLPWDWARLNSWPEWHVADDSTQVVKTAGALAQEPMEIDGGLELNLPAQGSATLLFTPRQPVTAR